jgi:nucleotide-binding universal stress UspA family protein
MYSSILCGIDGSDDARVALRAAAQLSVQLEVRLVAAHVVQTVDAAPGLGVAAGALGGASAEALEAGRQLLGRILEEEGLAGAERRVVHGPPAESLANLADDEDAEFIVVGSRGRGAFKAALLGSVSTDLISVARRPVLVVPRGAALDGGVRPAAARTA